jgi:DNA polymerase (family X)
MNKNAEIADIFDSMADVLEFKGEIVFKINAYRKAARILREYPEDISKVNPTDIEGIGKGMAEKINEYLATGEIKKYNEVISGIPKGLMEILNVPDLGPKTLHLVYKELGVKSLEDLEDVVENGSLAGLPGMGEKKVQNIKRGIELYREGRSRIPIGIALPVVSEMLSSLKSITEKISPAGSLRRMKETVGDIDILVTDENRDKILERFVTHPSVKNILLKGSTKASVIVTSHNLQVDMRVVDKDCWGAALQYFTGSKDHNVKIRGLAKDKKLKINEYGVFRGEKKIAGETEEGVYKTLGMEWIPPELREDRGEIEASLEGKLPELVELRDIRGDIHIHSNYSDGTNDIETIVLAAKDMGYEYVGISDHSKSSRIAGGLDENTLKKRNAEIKELQKRIQGIKILMGMEVDILSDGKLDYSDDILEQLDYVIASVHQGFKKNVTERMKKAIENPFVDIIAHPTGRLLSGREGYDINLDEVMKYAVKRNVTLEINASYDRLDLNDVNILKAKSFGAKFLIGTDAHNTKMLRNTELGIGMARRGWLGKNDIINTYLWDKIPIRRKR